MIAAAIDLGSNTLKYTIADLARGELRVLFEDAEITRIGHNLSSTGRLGDAPMARTLAALTRAKQAADAHGATLVRCVATAGMRGAENADEFVARARHEAGIEIEIIDGLREAALSFLSPSLDYGAQGSLTVIDVGGRSTEIIVGADAIESRVSLPVGGVRLTEAFFDTDPPTDVALSAAAEHIRAVLAADAPAAPADTRLVGVSGTIIALLGMQLDEDDIGEVVRVGEGTELFADHVKRALSSLAVVPTAARVRGSIIPAGRADVIVAGALVVDAIFDHYKQRSMTVSQRGVRYGLLREIALQSSTAIA